MTDPKPAKPKGRAKACGTPPSTSMRLTPAEKRFCLKYTETGRKIPSYREAFSCDHRDDKVVWRRVERLLTYPRIQKELQDLKDAIMAKHNVTVDSLIEELEEARKAALHAETPQAAAAVSATMGKAKLTGLEKSKVEVSGPEGQAFMPTRIEIVAPNVKPVRKG